MKSLMLLLMVACVGAIGYVVTQGVEQTYDLAGQMIQGTKAVAAAGLTLCGAAVIFMGLTWVSMLKTAMWIGIILIGIGLATGVIGN